MSKIIAFCGLVCSDCATYLATQKDDKDAREKTARLYSEKFGFDLKPEDINCDGCHTKGGMMIPFCRNCDIRKCGQEKGLENCAQCGQAPCDELAEFHTFSPDAKKSFETLIK